MMRLLGKSARKPIEPEFIWPGKEPDVEDWDENPDLTTKTARLLRVAYQVLYHLWLWMALSLPVFFVAIFFAPPIAVLEWLSLPSGLILLAVLRRRQLARWYQRWKQVRAESRRRI